MTHFGVNEIFKKSHIIFISFLKIWTFKKLQTWKVDNSSYKEKNKTIIWLAQHEIIIWSTSGVASTRRKACKHDGMTRQLGI
jgi:hypothetical protein